ncbi:putative LPS assembly protein LptD [Saccharicrinis sp. FJH62]|uniref:putative LPS assembly protein LptD n=1 Tax=Saccharicrinis sp. FJH62 TaxID=3344657 RepID=UPI0035D3FC03
MISCLFCGQALLAQNADRDSLVFPSDSIRSLPDKVAADTIPKDSATVITTEERIAMISPTKSLFAANVDYNADSIVMIGTSEVEMFGNASVVYGETDLKSYYIWMNLDSSLIYARGRLDSTNTLVETPEFTDDGTTYNQEELTYNYNTGKALIKNVVTEQGEGFVTSETTKRIGEDAFCMKNGEYTTCANHDHPHFYLKMTKAKVRPGKNIVTGPAYMVMEDVPIYPLFIPFGFFPFTKSYSSGFVMPSYGEENNRGFYLRDGGYYFALNDYFDLSTTGDIYSKGSWAVRARSNYRLKYRFNGSVNISYINNVVGEKALAGDYTATKDFSIRWTHSQDSKAAAYSNFSASVDFTSTSFEKNSIGVESVIYNPSYLARNQKSSSVSYSRTFPGTPFSMSSTLLASQNAADSSLSLTLPQLNLNMSRIYPFKRKKKIGRDRWYEKIGMSYSATLSNSVSDKQAAIMNGDPSVHWRNGVRHSIPVSTSFNILKNISISPSVSYTERWYTESINKTVDTLDNMTTKVVTDTANGFYRVYDYNASVSASTKLYGFYTPFRKLFGDKVEQIRHVMTPSVSLSYRPDFGQEKWGYYDTYTEYNAATDEWLTREYSHFQGSLYGTPGSGKYGAASFSVGNNVEMKVKNDADSTGNGFKKIKLLESLNFATSYNMAIDSMRWSDISVRGRTKLFKGLSINAGATFDPYVTTVNSNGRVIRINQTHWERDRSIGKLKNLTLSTGYSFNNEKLKSFLKGFSGGGDEAETKTADDSEGKSSDSKSKSDSKYDDDGYLLFKIPWNLSFSYSYSLRGAYDKTMDDFKYTGVSNFRFNGSLTLTEKWSMNFSSGYDFRNREITSTNLSINRNLHCWSMSFNAVPFGRYKTYNFTIHVNSSMLQDLKYEKRSSPWDNPGWNQ